MWSKTVLALALVVALGVLATKSPHALYHSGPWRDLDSDEHMILFSPPFMGNWNPGISVGVRDSSASRMEWLCWRDFESHEANACITYQKQGIRFPYQTASDALHYYDGIKETKKIITRKSKKLDHEIGAFDTVRFTSNSLGTKKDCVAFSVQFGTQRQVIVGWYCAPVDISLSEPIIQKMISTIGLKGRNEPAIVTYSKLSDAASAPEPAVTTVRDYNERRLCGAALTLGRTRWETRRMFLPAVKEAQRRGFSVEDCRNLVASTGPSKDEAQTSTSVKERLQQVEKLLDSGLITPEEAAAKRTAILDDL